MDTEVASAAAELQSLKEELASYAGRAGVAKDAEAKAAAELASIEIAIEQAKNERDRLTAEIKRLQILSLDPGANSVPASEKNSGDGTQGSETADTEDNPVSTEGGP